MPLTRHIQLPAPQLGGYDGETIIKLKGGLVYHTIELDTNLKHYSTIRKITIDIGGTPVAIAEGKTLDLLDKTYGKYQEEGRIVFDLSKFEYKTPDGMYTTALATGVQDDVTLKIDVGARNTTSGNEDPASLTLKGKADVWDNPYAAAPGAGRNVVPIRQYYTLDSPAAGEMDFAFPNANASKSVQRLLFDEKNVQISKIDVKLGDRLIDEFPRKDIDFRMKRVAKANLQSGYLMVDFCALGFGAADSRNTQGMNFTIHTNGQGAIRLYVEGFERIAA